MQQQSGFKVMSLAVWALSFVMPLSACAGLQPEMNTTDNPGEVVRPSKVTFSGEFTQGGMIVGQVDQASSIESITVMGKEVLLTKDGRFVFGLGRNAAATVSVVIKQHAQSPVEVSTSVTQRKYNIQKIEGVAKKHVTPPKEVTSRIAAEAAKVRKARRINDDRLDFLSDFIWPLTGPITGVYGSQRFYNGVPRSPHYGIDIAAPTGTNVIAPASGVVTLAEPDLYYSGGTLILDHGHGVSSTFIHLHKVLVDVGARIDQGQVIAQVGASGRATGPHLDWRMNWFDQRIDPGVLMANTPMPKPHAPE